MKKNLYRDYKNCKDYYRYSLDNFPINFTEKECSDFIQNYFRISGKEKIFDLSDISITIKRSEHSVSIFFLGLTLVAIIKNNINNLKKETFSYIWFLLCLFHDIMYVEENINNSNIKYNDLDCFLYKQGVKHNVYLHKNHIDYNYSESLVKNYFKYRISQGKQDHGICAGYLLYDRLVKNYNNKFKESNSNNKDFFETDNLNWNIKHQDYYAIAAHTIIEHNVWLCNKNDNKINVYKQYDLLDLIRIKEKESRINIKDSPWLFYFGLLDTIEPTKVLANSNIEPIEILNNIDIEFKLSQKVLLIKFSDKIIENTSFEQWINKISDLPNWLNLEIDTRDKYNGKIKIIF